MEIFWNTIAQYNEGTWQAQFIITLAGIALTLLLYRKPTLWVKRSMKIYMVFLNGWISTVYYLMYCGTRNYHHILAIFWGVIALIWLWDLFADYTPFERNPRYKMLVGVLYAMPFLYPLLSWARGMEFPMMTTTVMPCSVAAFTIGLLLAFHGKSTCLSFFSCATGHSSPSPKSISIRFRKTSCWQVPRYLPFTCSSRTTSTRTCTKKPNRAHDS